MRKPVISHIFGLCALYCAVFIFLVIIQFSNKGNFNISIGDLAVRGRYLQQIDRAVDFGIREISDGVKVFFSGMECNLRGEHSKGLFLSYINGNHTEVNPQKMAVDENSVLLELPGGSALIFSCIPSTYGTELKISGVFSDDVDAIHIPITPRRSSLVFSNEQYGFLFNGMRYVFSYATSEIEKGFLVISAETPIVFYRPTGKQKTFEPMDYTVAFSNNSGEYEDFLHKWQNQSYLNWKQYDLYTENDVTAYCAESLNQGDFRQAVISASRDYLNTQKHGYFSSGFLGGMTRAFRLFSDAEKSKLDSITVLTRTQSLDVLKEFHILKYFLVRGNTSLAVEIAELLRNANTDQLQLEHCPGVLEFFEDYNQWNSSTDNPAEKHISHVQDILSTVLYRDSGFANGAVANGAANGDAAGTGAAPSGSVYISANDAIDPVFNARVGKALYAWAELTGNSDWAAVGRSLVLSALQEVDSDAGSLWYVLDPARYYPRAIPIAQLGLWTWTVTPVVNAVNQAGNINITYSFPENQTHYVIIQGVKPFVKIQIHNMDFRSDRQFETYDSSGWVYYQQEQSLVIKLKHRTTMESVKIFYRVDIDE
jgi:hypothetical protein